MFVRLYLVTIIISNVHKVKGEMNMVKIAIVGAGFMGDTHATAYENMENAVLMAVCDQNAEKGKALAEKFHCAHYADFNEMIAACELDMIDICLPTFLHEQFVIQAANAGKHIICEKPVTLNVESLDRMLEAVDRNHVTMYVGQVVRFWPEYVEAKKLLENGTLGELKSYYAARLSEHPAWSEWYRKVENSGGGLLDLHLHDIDYACYLFGRPEKVYAIGQKNKYGSWNHVSSMLTFANGFSATIEGILEMPAGYPFTMQLRMAGSEKAFEYIMKAGKNLEDVASAGRASYLYGDGESKKLSIQEKDAYTIELQHFVNCIDQNRVSEVLNMQQVREVLCTIRALNQSLEEKREVIVSYE